MKKNQYVSPEVRHVDFRPLVEFFLKLDSLCYHAEAQLLISATASLFARQTIVKEAPDEQ